MLRSRYICVRLRNFSNARLFEENLNILYDRKCSLCRVEIDFLKKKDGMNKRLRFTDVENELFDDRDPENGGVSYEDAMKKIHVITSSGQKILGVHAIRAAYDEVGLGWIYSFLSIPFVGATADIVYDAWAGVRTNITRGESLDDIFAKRRKQQDCADRTCNINDIKQQF